MTKHVPIGIYNEEIFIAQIEDGNIDGFDVLRVVEKDRLETFRDPDSEDTRSYYKDFWKAAVASNSTEASLSEFVEEIFNDGDYDESDEEDFPGKDEYGLQFLTEEQRKQADEFIEDTTDKEVGTWEDCGWYSPKGNFDLFFEDEEAQEWLPKVREYLERH